MKRSFEHRPITEGWALNRCVTSKTTYYLTTPRDIDCTAIKNYLKTLPGYGMIIVEDNEIWFNTTLSRKELMKKMCEMLGLEKPKRYGAGGGDGHPKKVYKFDEAGRLVAEYNSGQEAANDSNLSNSSISKSIHKGIYIKGYRYSHTL